MPFLRFWFIHDPVVHCYPVVHEHFSVLLVSSAFCLAYEIHLFQCWCDVRRKLSSWVWFEAFLKTSWIRSWNIWNFWWEYSVRGWSRGRGKGVIVWMLQGFFTESSLSNPYRTSSGIKLPSRSVQKTVLVSFVHPLRWRFSIGFAQLIIPTVSYNTAFFK